MLNDLLNKNECVYFVADRHPENSNCHLPHLIFTPDKIFYTCGRIQNFNNKIMLDKGRITLESPVQYKKLKEDFEKEMGRCFEYCLYENSDGAP